MKKREFLKSVSVLAAGAAFPQLRSCGNNTTETTQTAEAVQVGRTNWAGNYTYSTDNLVAPKTVEELQEFIKSNKDYFILSKKEALPILYVLYNLLGEISNKQLINFDFGATMCLIIK